jgi:hypothetical protein
VVLCKIKQREWREKGRQRQDSQRQAIINRKTRTRRIFCSKQRRETDKRPNRQTQVTMPLNMSWSKFQETKMNALAFLYAFRSLGALLFRREMREVNELNFYRF